MKSLLSIVTIIFFTLDCFSTVVREDVTITFKSDHHELTDASIKELNNFLKWTEFRGDYIFYISGHTDQDGTYAYNEALSLKRSEAVRDFFLSKGADLKCMRITHHGERKLLFVDEDDSYKERNRRVTVEYNRYEFDDIDELNAEIAKRNFNQFSVDPLKNHIVTTQQNIELYIQPESFVKSDGSKVEGEVKIEVRDAIDPMAFLSEDLSTMSGVDILETGGMLKIEARTAQGELLKLAEGKEITVSVPNELMQPEMELYYSDDGADWVNSEVPVLTPSADFTVKPRIPVRMFPKFRYKKFRPDYKTKPSKAYEPTYPREPVKPSEKDYSRFYNNYKGSKKKKEKYANSRMEREEKNYVKDMLKYESRLMNAKKRCDNFYIEHNNYQAMLASWEADQEILKAQYEIDVIGPAKAVYEKKHKYQLEAYEIEMENYWKEYKSWLAEVEDRTTGTMDAGNYLFNTTQLTWLNIDRKIAESDRSNLVVESDKDYNQKLCLIEDNGRVAVSLGAQIPGEYRTSVSKTKKAVLVAYRVVDGQLYSFVQDIRGKDRIQVQYRPVTYLELRNTLEGLNS